MTGFVALFLMLFSFSFALAENASVNDSVNNSDVPILISAPLVDDNVSESEASGNFFWKQADIWFTFNQEKKAEKELKLAELQLVRARIAERNNNTKAMEKALEAHQKLIERVKERISRFDNTSGNVTKLIGLERALEVHQFRIDKLNETLGNANLTAEQREKLQERLGQAQENTDHLIEVAQEKRDKLEQRKMNLSGNGSREKAMGRNRNGSENESESEDETESELEDNSSEDSNETD